MANTYFRFKQFTVHQQHSAMKVTTDACVFGGWVAQLLQKENQTFLQALDIGAGTGLLSLMVAQKTALEIDAIEIDQPAAQQTRENFARSPWHHRLQVIEGDVNNCPLQNGYDCIFSNPPFYDGELASPDAARNTAHHSEQLKLEQLFQIIKLQLRNDGLFFLLLPYKRKNEIERLLAAAGLWLHAVVEVHHSAAHTPFRLLLKGGKIEKGQKEKETFYIKDAAGRYTPAFVQLMKEYYLYL